MLASTHIANQVLAKCFLQNANAKCLHPPILRACKNAKCIGKAYCILAILAGCMRSCKNAIWQHSWHDFSRIQNAFILDKDAKCLHPPILHSCTPRKGHLQIANDKVRASCILAKCKMQNAKCKELQWGLPDSMIFLCILWITSLKPKPTYKVSWD